MSNPLVSIITPCYNGEAYLDRYFNSILNQTYRPLELIFVNDGSTDRTAEIAEHYAPVLEEGNISFIYLHQEKAGQAAALNRGLKLFTGEYLTWPDADDEMTPDCIEKKVAFLQANPELDMCICKVIQVDEKHPDYILGILERKCPSEQDNLVDDLIFFKNVFYVPGGYMVRGVSLDRFIPERDIYQGPGGQNGQILLPFAYHGKTGYLNEILYRYYIRSDSHSHSANTSEKIICQNENFERILLATLQRISLDLYDQYCRPIRCHYARQRYGNALDSRNPAIVRTYYRELYELGIATIPDWLRYIKCCLFRFGK